MKKRPSIISDPTLEEVLADEDIFIAGDENDSRDSRADKDSENSDNEDEEHVITNELKR